MNNERINNKPKNMKGTIKRVFKYIFEFKWLLFVVVILACFAALLGVTGPKVLGMATTKIYEGLIENGIDFKYIGILLLILTGIYLISFVFSFISERIMGKVQQKIVYKLRFDLDNKLMRLPLKFYDGFTNGEIISRVNDDVSSVSDGLFQAFTGFVRSTFNVIGIVIMMFMINVNLTLITFVIIPVSMILISLIMKYSQKYFKQQKKYLGDLDSKIEESYSGHIIIKSFNHEDEVTDDFSKINNNLYKASWKSNFISSLMQPLVRIVSNAFYVVICILGADLVMKGKIKIGDIQAFIQYSRQFMNPLVESTEIFSVLQSVAASAERIFEILDYEEEVIDLKDEKIEEVLGNIDVKNIKFSYNPENTLIKDLSFSVKKGQTIAIVGPTGAGKTTIVNLLMRFYEIQGGDILIDGISSRDMKKNEVRGLFGMVLQDTWLFNGTIMDNIRYGKKDATDDEVINACVLAHADTFIRSLPDSYNFVLNEDANNISSGQKQLLTIARAILADKPILILDEATSNVDTRTEILIDEAMDKLMEGRTSFVIAHRLSTIRNADLILVMDHGSVIEQGTHESLMKSDGFYAKLYDSQFEN